MKKLFMLATLLFTVTISSTTLAANWVHVATSKDEYLPINLYVDKDSIRRSTNPKFSYPDGVLAVVKQVSNKQTFDEGVDEIMGFWTKDGKKYFDYLTSYLDGNSTCYNGMVARGEWGIVWDYVQSNLP